MNKSALRGNENIFSMHAKKNNGITLITLVITIVILLILAGITINSLVGDNGILSRVGTAKEQTKKENAIEDVKLAWTETLIEYETRTGEDTSKTKSDYYTKTNVGDNLNDGTIADEEGSFVYNENGTSRLVYINNQNERYIVEIDEYGNIQVVDNSNITGADQFVATSHKVTIAKGGTYQITSSSELTWTSENTDIATVTIDETKAVITGVEEGNTIITGKNANGTTVIECTLSVTPSGGSVYSWFKYNLNKSDVYGYKIDNTETQLSSSYSNDYVSFAYSYEFDPTNGYFCPSAFVDSLTMSQLKTMLSANWNSSNVAYHVYTFSDTIKCSSLETVLRPAKYMHYVTQRIEDWNTTYGYKFKGICFTSYVQSTQYSNGGTKIEEVTSTNPTEYPSNGAQGDYWYVLQGVK